MCFNLYPLPLFLSVGTTENSLISTTSFSPIKELYMLKKFAWDFFFPAEQSPNSQPLLIRTMLQSLNIFGALWALWGSETCFMSILFWELHTALHMPPHQCCTERKINLPQTAGNLLKIYSGRKKRSHITTLVIFSIKFPIKENII